MLVRTPFARLSLAPLALIALLLAPACSEDPPGAALDALPPSTLDGTGGGGDGGPNPSEDTGTGPGPADASDGGGGGGADVPAPDLGTANPNNPNNATLDTDCDGLSDAYEFATIYPDGQRTSPTNPDTDGDGLSDGLEAGVTAGVTGASCTPTALDTDPTTRTSPTAADSDGDGVSDGVEDRNRNGAVDTDETNPRARDTDGDGIADGVEDANRNGTVDAGETSPRARDTDGDGIADGVEDINRNGQIDPGETSPVNVDSDGDTLGDGVEDSNRNGSREATETDARSPDTDCDGLRDDEELTLMTSPILADTDRDGIADGVELGRTMAVPGSTCPGFVPDADPATMTSPLNPDSDMDGVPDGGEDTNGNGRVDMGELNPGNADSDMDGIADGDEVLAGTNPLDPMSPSPDIRSGVTSICSDAALKVVDFDQNAMADWTLANEQSTAYVPLTVNVADTYAAALDDSTQQFAGFVLAMPSFPAGLDANAQLNALLMRINGSAGAQQLNVVQRSAPRQITSHDTFPTAVSGVYEVSVLANPRNASSLRNSLLYIMSGQGAGAYAGLPTNVGGAGSQFVLNFQILVRPAQSRVIIVAAVLDRATYDGTSNASFFLNDLTNGSALALNGARRGKACNPFVTAGQAVADFIWMSDISGSTDDDRGRVAQAAQRVFQELSNNGVDFRMGVVQHTENSIIRGAGNGGTLLGNGFTRNQADFVNSFNQGGGDGCEFGLDAASSAITRALPRTPAGTPENARRLREGATLAVLYISDEYAQEITEGQCGIDPGGAACNTGVGDLFSASNNNICQFAPNAAQQACIDQVVAPYIQQIRDQGGVAFAQVINPNPAGACNQGQFRCPQPGSQEANEPGRGYIEVVNAFGGTYYSPCVDNPGQALQAIVDAVTGAASQFQLTGQPISSTVKVGVTRMGTGMTQEVPRSKTNGFDYDPVSNSIFFRGSSRPAVGDRVTVSYRVWLPPEAPCGRPCGPNQICDGQLGVCTCDQGQCNAACGPNQVCDANCACTCTPDCNGNCGPNQVCNQATCACECPADCGGCGPGTVCNPTTCACECDQNCGGACAGTNTVCNTAACNCQCPSDCGGNCGPGLVCNTSTCDCACPADCDAACGGAGRCDPNNNCACACPADCGGCPDGTICNATACACECPATACQNCSGNRVCDPSTNCGCVCPADCGGCGPTERCDQTQCLCVPGV
jgi:hypothetical protein